VVATLAQIAANSGHLPGSKLSLSIELAYPADSRSSEASKAGLDAQPSSGLMIFQCSSCFVK
jgi:hypothetical protein